MEVEGAPKSFFALFTYQTFGASKKISLCVAQYHYRGAIISLARKREYNCGAVRDSNLIPSLRLGGWFRGTLMGRKKGEEEGFEPNSQIRGRI